MDKKFLENNRVFPGNPYPLGVRLCENGVNISVEYRGSDPLFLVLVDLTDRRRRQEIPFDMDQALGAVYSMRLEGAEFSRFGYLFRAGNQDFMDPRAIRTSGNEVWGHPNHTLALFPSQEEPGLSECLRCLTQREAEAAGNPRPRLSYRESVFYLLHVRGFTKHKSSGVTHPGTFEGVQEKIPYLKDLGITTVELLPPYDFDEVMPEKPFENTAEAETAPEKSALQKRNRVNYWGFTGGNYLTPKNSYSADGNGPRSFLAMVEAFHEAGMEVIVDFYFEPHTDPVFILKCLHLWLLLYRVDGFRVLGTELPVKAILADPYLADAKILLDSFPEGDPVIRRQVPGGKGALNCWKGRTDGEKRHLAVLNPAFMYDNRKFLKSDEDMLRAFTKHLLENPDNAAVINFMTSYYGFNMHDMVSFDQKHNDANGENNTDGNNYNYSWNCGVEGSTRKKNVLQLRRRQVRNAFTYLFLSQGVPEILAGDEFLHSQKGNNNAYCQDNEVTWLNWNNLEKNRDIFEFVKTLIALRAAHPVFRSEQPKRLMDPLSCGYPDVSFHGEQAWAPRFDNFYRHIGVLYAGAYEKGADGEQDADFFTAFNMHWQTRSFALPKALPGRKWVTVFDTSAGFAEIPEEVEGSSFEVEPRSIRVLKSVEVPKGSGGTKKK